MLDFNAGIWVSLKAFERKTAYGGGGIVVQANVGVDALPSVEIGDETAASFNNHAPVIPPTYLSWPLRMIDILKRWRKPFYEKEKSRVPKVLYF